MNFPNNPLIYFLSLWGRRQRGVTVMAVRGRREKSELIWLNYKLSVHSN